MQKQTSQKTQLRSFAAVALVAAAFSLLTAACSQDPLADQSEDVRRGVAPAEKGSNEVEAISRNLLRLQGASSLTAKEGETLKTTLKGVMLQPKNGHEPVQGQDFEVIVTNLADLKGATYDAATGEFVWTPAKGFVDEELTRNAVINITIATLAKPIIAEQFTVPVVVVRSAQTPEVVSVQFADQGPIREGTQARFTVTIRDPQALDATNKRPIVYAMSPSGSKLSISSFVKVTQVATVDPTDKTLFTIPMILDLTDREVTHKKDTFTFELVAVSRFGEMSPPKSVDVPVITSLRDPVMSQSVATTVYRGKENVIHFTISDVMNESAISVNWTGRPQRCDSLPGGSSCECTPDNRENTVQSCTFTWSPDNTVPEGLVEQVLQVQSNSRVPGDTIAPKQTEFTLRFQVPAAPATPAPTPANGGN